MKYCSKYRCGRVLPENFEGTECLYCGASDKYAYLDSHRYINSLPLEAFEIEQKCRKCGSTEELCYHEKHDYGSFQTGNYYECRSCRDAFYAEMDREEAMHYIVINNYSDEIEFYADKHELEQELDEISSDWDYENLENIDEHLIILKVEKIEGYPELRDFQNRNVFYYNDVFYRVEEVIQPYFESDSSCTINW